MSTAFSGRETTNTTCHGVSRRPLRDEPWALTLDLRERRSADSRAREKHRCFKSSSNKKGEDGWKQKEQAMNKPCSTWKSKEIMMFVQVLR